MKQVTQRLRDGRIAVEDVPAPQLRPEGVLVAVRASVVSTGTERNKVQTGRKSLLGKARSRPEDVRKVLEKARSEGVVETIQAVRTRLEQPAPLGYSSAGVVLAAGARVTDVAVGDRVACGGGGYAVHAEMEYVPGNLAVRIPGDVGFDAAAFTTIGAVALHAVRQADVRLGELVAVIGLGLVGQLAGQILRAAGCRVVGIDLSAELVARAVRDGAADAGFPRAELDGMLPPHARECDAVVIAAATASSDPIRLAADLCRDRGRVVVLGEVGMDVPRGVYYQKELDLRTSRSYGPGRYDRNYEERGLDYPIGYVRWTQRRNMAAFLDLLAHRKVDVEPLIAERVPIEDAVPAYERLVAASPSPLGIVLEYSGAAAEVVAAPPLSRRAAGPAVPTSIGVVGAGSFANRILIPGLHAAGFDLAAVASATGLSARAASERFAFGRATSIEDILADDGIGTVVIATRHSSHAGLAAAALSAGKAVFVEKPPALTEDELRELRDAREQLGGTLAVGFNRRHAPLALALRDHVRRDGFPFQLVYRVNAGRLPDDHWANDLDEGGGRLLGEGCHFVDFACWFAGAAPARVVCSFAPEAGRPLAQAQSFHATLTFGGGSLATIVYSADAADRLPKEYVEAHSVGRSAILDNFRRLTLHGADGVRRLGGRAQDKGHRAQLVAFRRLVTKGEQPLPDPLDSMAATLAALRSAELGGTVTATTQG